MYLCVSAKQIIAERTKSAARAQPAGEKLMAEQVRNVVAQPGVWMDPIVPSRWE